MTRASCLCGDVAWEAREPFAFMHHCHCVRCRKAAWYEIHDEVPRFDAYPPGVDAAVFPDLERPRGTAGEIPGSCLCGAVRYVVTGEPLLARYCHCSRCRKARGAAHAANVVMP